MTKSFYVISLDVDKRFATEEGNEVTLNASTVDLQRGSLFGPSFIGNFCLHRHPRAMCRKNYQGSRILSEY